MLNGAAVVMESRYILSTGKRSALAPVFGPEKRCADAKALEGKKRGNPPLGRGLIPLGSGGGLQLESANSRQDIGEQIVPEVQP